MALKRFFEAAAISLVLLAACSVAVLVLDRDYSSIGTTIATFVPVAAVFGILIPAFRSKSRRPSNYPRIEHLRIAGKYQVAGSSANAPGTEYRWSMGSSPLRLR